MKYAIVESGGKQFRAVEGGTIEVDRLLVESGTQIKLEQVLLVADGETITVGTPFVNNTPVWTTVIEHFKGPKVNIFNYSPKKRIRVKIGHRQNYTRLFIEQVGGSELTKREPANVVSAVEVPAEKIAPKSKAEAGKEQGKPEPKSRLSAVKATASTKAKKPVDKSETKPAAQKTSAVKSKPAPSLKGPKPSKGTTSAKKATTPKKPASSKKTTHSKGK